MYHIGTEGNGAKAYFDVFDSLILHQKDDFCFAMRSKRPPLDRANAIADAQKRVEEAYRDQQRWSKMAMMNTACSGKFTSDRTIEEYVRDIWHLEKVEVPSGQDLFE